MLSRPSPAPAEAPAALPRAGTRSFLFLLGPCSPFQARLAPALEAEGHRVVKVLLHAGDALFWRRPALHYRGGLDAWQDHVGRLMDEHGTTDLVVHNESREYHRLAILEARRRGIRVLVFEMGYFRPDWITFERDGLSALSHFPRDPALVRALAAEAPEPDFSVRFRTPFLRFALNDLAYHLGEVFGTPLYPRYRRYAIDNPVVEYLLWGRKLLTRRRPEAAAAAVVEKLEAGAAPWYVLPLQLSGDFQIRAHSPFPDMPAAMRAVVASFGRHAPAAARLVVKLHPLDNLRTPWAKLVAEAAAEAGAAGRVDCIDGGDLARLIAGSEGVVTVNSTVGIAAIQAGRPTIALGGAVFDIPGLTFQDGLDRFWAGRRPPDRDLASAFVRALVHTTQIRGDYYTEPGMAAAVQGVVERLKAGLPDLPERIARMRSA
ncbi:capsule biosynthesis protein [Prosthecomicrobium sp. N25]|uniref:capsule biosynthesis protein n=1 Tax=Prosthecomicrobium sp. N25 TaxID=3129254 RepID=UPI0030769D84